MGQDGKYTSCVHMGLREFDPADFEKFLPRDQVITRDDRLCLQGAAFLVGLQHWESSELLSVPEAMHLANF